MVPDDPGFRSSCATEIPEGSVVDVMEMSLALQQTLEVDGEPVLAMLM